MTRWRKKLDLGSRRAIQKGVRQLRELGFISSPVRKTYHEPIQHYGTMAYTKRLAVVLLRNGTKVLVLATSPSTGDPKPWIPYQVDIKHPAPPISTSKKAKPQEVIGLQLACKNPVAWSPRKYPVGDLLDFWGHKLAKWRQITVRERMA